MASFARSSLMAGRAMQPTSVLSSRVARSAFVKNAIPSATRVAAFHATSRKSILPPLPQVVQGTANDAAPVHDPHPAHGSYHWTFERLVSAALIPVTIAPFAGGSLNPTMDAALCALLIAHSHMGFQACIIDYFPSKRVPFVRKGCEWLLRFASLGVAVGLYEFETNDVGVTEAIKRIWKA